MRRKSFAIVLIAGAIAYGCALRSVNTELVRESAQRILDEELEANNLKVAQLQVPNLAFFPFVSPSSWKAYLFIAGKNDRPLNHQVCPTTVDYEVWRSNSQAIWEAGTIAVRVYLAKLQQCSNALRASGL